ncbi:hypothetical protein Acy02nite_73730 [Actinoplanes cyaneus]|uniref:Uncharacterized protein n=1 Tax=Actinoplanes cyaneus TaxID=52696 RepID=A0A919IQK1_9ACTN|nr:hypothetical protein [Actinoplanes cyaneus]MCW2135509.1 hypothetical protein [Actinoplanes cyaneus]GID69492.1 hypothetical protein Acy02nite_73730 [Actinoplanes cyaneus]
MSDHMIRVEWADVSGTGFSPQRRDDEDVAPEYWTAAEAMLHDDLSQPPEGLRRTGEHPVWTLRRVVVGNARTWCFVVQGRRGPFGVAGTCRFGFAPPGMGAYESWRCGAEQVAEPSDPPEEEPPPGLLSVVLGGILLGQRVIPIARPPAEAAWVIRRALGVVPEQEARRWSWSTCLLQPPGGGSPRVVAGRWPPGFHDEEPDLGRAVRQTFAGGPVTGEQVAAFLADPAAERSFEQLVVRAAQGRTHPGRLRGDLSLLEMIRQGRGSALPVRQEEALEMLGTRHGRDELAREHLDKVRRIGLDHPEQARRILSGMRIEPVLEQELLAGLIQAQDRTEENPLGLPTGRDPGSAAWLLRLAELFREAYRPDERAGHALRWWRSHRPWKTNLDLVAARDWLLSAGLLVPDAPELFPIRTEVIIGELRRHHRVTPAAREELLHVRQPVELMRIIMAEAPPLPVETTEDLIRTLTGTDRRAAAELRVLVNRGPESPREAPKAPPRDAGEIPVAGWSRNNTLMIVAVIVATLAAMTVILIFGQDRKDDGDRAPQPVTSTAAPQPVTSTAAPSAPGLPVPGQS